MSFLGLGACEIHTLKPASAQRVAREGTPWKSSVVRRELGSGSIGGDSLTIDLKSSCERRSARIK